MNSKYVMTLFSISSSLFFAPSVLAQESGYTNQTCVTSDSSQSEDGTSTTQEKTLLEAESSLVLSELVDTTKELTDQSFISDTANQSMSSSEEEFTTEVKDVPFVLKDWKSKETKDTITLEEYIGSEKEITIPTSYKGKQVQISNLHLPKTIEHFSLRVVNEGEKVVVTKEGLSFSGNQQLQSLDLKALDMKEVESLNGMFENCRSLRQIDVTGWDTREVRSARQVFRNATSLQYLIGYEEWKLPKAENFYQMFSGANALKELSLDHWKKDNEVKKVIFTEAFANMDSLEKLSINGWKGDVYVLNRLAQENPQLKVAQFNDWDVKEIETAERWFYQNPKLTTVEMKDWDCTNVQEWNEGWLNCSSLEKINSNQSWKIQKECNRLFMNCTKLESVLSFSFGKNVVELIEVFKNAESLTHVDTSQWSTSQFKDISGLFSGATSLEDIEGLDQWTLEKIEKMNQTFKDCTKLKYIDLSKSKPKHLREANEAFMNTLALKELYLTHWNPSSLQRKEDMFFGASNLAVLDIEDWKFSPSEVNDWLLQLKLFANSQSFLLISNQKLISEEDLLKLGFQKPGPVVKGEKEKFYFSSMVLSGEEFAKEGNLSSLKNWTLQEWKRLNLPQEDQKQIVTSLERYQLISDYFEEVISIRNNRIADNDPDIRDEEFYHLPGQINFAGKLYSQGTQQFPRTSGGHPKVIIASRSRQSWDLTAKLYVNNDADIDGVSVLLNNDNAFRFNTIPKQFEEIPSGDVSFIVGNCVVTKDETLLSQARLVKRKGYYAFYIPDLKLQFSEVRRAPVMNSKVWVRWNLKKVPNAL